MKKLLVLVLLTLSFQVIANPTLPNNEDCNTKVVKSAAYKNGVVKKSNGEVLTNQETMSIEIDPCNYTVLVEIN